jgi:GAF domain-containing protein
VHHEQPPPPDPAALLELLRAQHRWDPDAEPHPGARPLDAALPGEAPGDRSEVAGPAARSGSFATYAVPLRLRTRVLGGLTLVRREPAPLPAEDQHLALALALAQALADAALLALMQWPAALRASGTP